MAEVVFDDDGGGGTGVWSLNTNWVGDALPLATDTFKISADCVLDMDDIVVGGVVDANMTFTMNEDTQLTGMTADITMSGNLVMLLGSDILFNSAAERTMNLTHGSTTIITGTVAKRCSILNSGAGVCKLYKNGSSTVDATFCDFHKIHNDIASYACGAVVLTDCEVSTVGKSGVPVLTDGTIHFIRCYIAPDSSGVDCIDAAGGAVFAEGLALGYERDGSAAPGSKGFDPNDAGDGFIGSCVIFNTTTIIKTSEARYATNVENFYVDNIGHVPAAMLPGTGSALDLANGDPGASLKPGWYGNVERSTSAKKTGDFGSRFTPLSTIAASPPLPLESSIYIPISTGDNISVSVYGRRHTMTNDCAEIEIDPEGAWFTPTIKATTLTLDDTWYEFATAANCAEGPGIGGSGGSCWGSGSGPDSCGMVRIVLRLKEYQAAAYFDWADMVVTIT